MHSPNEENMDWDVSKAMATLQTFPENETINWSSMARTFNIPKMGWKKRPKNMELTHWSWTRLGQTPRLRRSKTKLQGQEFSMPTKDAVVQEKNHLIASGELSIGEPCSLKKSQWWQPTNKVSWALWSPNWTQRYTTEKASRVHALDTTNWYHEND